MKRVFLAAALLAGLVSAAVAQVYGPGTGSGGGGTPGGTPGQIQYNNGGAFGGFTQGGDCTTDTSTGTTTCLTLNSVAPGPFFGVAWPTVSDGLGSDGSAFLPWTFGTGFAKSGTVWNLTTTLNTQSGNSAYTILSTDASKTVNRTNTVTQTDPVPQATGSFASGFGFSYQTGTVGNTLTSTTSTINGIAGATGIKLGPQQGADFFSDGTNWHAHLGVPQCATQTGTTFVRDDYTCAAAAQQGVANTFTAAQTFGEVHGGGRIVSTTSDTPAVTDCGKTIHFTSGSSIAVTMPNNITALECTITFIQEGAGQITFSAASGAAIHSFHSYTKTAGQWAVVDMILNTNAGGTSAVYTLAGDGA
jgi:hypothetical protein